jgi:hypothetical protein
MTKRVFRFWLVWAIVTGPSLAYAQTSNIRWWSLDGGFQYSPGSGVRITAAVAENAPGEMQGDKLRLIGGFLGYPGVGAAVLDIHAHPMSPAEFSVAQNFPNPFNPTTVVRFQLPTLSDVRLVIYDLLGREVRMLVNETKPAGSYEVKFDATALASGVYLYRLTAGDFVQTRKMIVIK